MDRIDQWIEREDVPFADEPDRDFKVGDRVKQIVNGRALVYTIDRISYSRGARIMLVRDERGNVSRLGLVAQARLRLAD